MKKMKKLAAVLICAMTLGLFTGCGNSFDAAGYIQAILDNSYKNDSTKFVSMKIGTAEEASETYEQSLEAEVDAMIMISGAEATDSQVESLRGIVKDIYGKVNYTVGEAEKQDDGSFLVSVTYEQVQVFGPAITAYLDEVANLAAAWDETTTEDEMNSQLMEAYIGSFQGALANVTFGDSATSTIKVELVNDVWQPNENDVMNFETGLFDIEALIEAVQ